MRKILLLSIFLSLSFLPYLNAQCPNIEAEISQTCSSNGSEVPLWINITGGVQPYEVRWEGEGTSGQKTFPTESGGLQLPVSPDYLIIIEDNNACIDTIYYESLSVTPNYDLEVSLKNGNSCAPGCSGSITFIAIGGNPSYTIEDDYGFEDIFTDTILIENLCPGIYSYTISDSLGCEQSLYNLLIDLDGGPPTIATSEVTPNTCVNGQNGSISVEVEGVAPFLYSWTGPDGFSTTTSDSIIYNLASGQYIVTITDGNGCLNLAEFEVETVVSDPISFQVATVNDICGICNGVVFISSVSGGYPPYTMVMGGESETFSNSTSLDNLCAGTYQFMITDSTGCTQTFRDFTILSEESFIIGNVTIEDNICDYTQNGSITVDVYGLYSNLSLVCHWTGPDDFSALTSEPTIDNLASGQYLLEISDNFGCSTNLPFEIGTMQTDVVLETSWTDATCTTLGTISVDLIEGENGPYGGYITNDNGNILTGDNLSEGTYYVCVIDANGCVNKCDTVIISNADLSLELNSSFANCESSGGMVTATLADTIITPTFEWSNGQTGDTLLDVAAGWYSVTVTDDARDCQSHQNVEVKLDPSCYVQISGYVYLDSEMADCVEDAATIPAEYVLVELSNGSMDFTDKNGYYEFQEEAGSYEVTVNLENTIYDPICVDPINIASLDFGDHAENNNFWLKYPEVEDLAVQLFTSAARPGFDQTVIAFVYNQGYVPTNGTLTLTHDSLQNFITSVPSGYTYDESSSTISWELGEIQPGTFERFDLQLNLPANTPLGTLINYRLTADPIDSDTYPANNMVEKQLTVAGSYDPNDKQVSPAGEGEEGVISRIDSILTYQVRFQNTGTDTAFTVVVLDEIDESLDIASVRPGPSSHPYKLNVLDGNVLEFRFENIMLPDSFVNEPASNGYVLFDIKTKKDLPWGTKIENTAAIYFDFNEPIITNTTINTLAQPTNLKEVITQNFPLEISPNPGSELSILKFSLEQSTQVDLGLYDTRGHLITQYLKSEDLQSGTHQVRFEETNLPQGIYFIMLKTADGMIGIEKWVKIE